MKLKIDEIKKLHGGYWRYNFLDFYYLFNSYFPTRKIKEELRKELPKLISDYPSTQITIAEFLSKWNKETFFNKENLIIGNGSSELIKILNKIITKITVPIPTFNEWVCLPKNKVNFFFLKEENNFKIDSNELIKKIKKDKSQFVVINNPNNPTGNVLNKKEIEEILKTGVVTIIDEAFIDFCSEYSVKSLIPKYENLIIIKSLTKSMGLGGLRLGYLLTINKKIKDEIRSNLPIWNINSLAEKFIEIFPNFKEEYKKSIEKVIKDRNYLFEKLKEISYLEPYEPFGNFIFCRTKISSQKIAQDLFDKCNILIKSGLNQEKLKSDNYIRIGVRAKKDNNKLILGLKEIERLNI